MAKIEFGFTCGSFSLAVTGNDILLPGSKNSPLGKSLVPYCDPNDAAGIYILRAESDGEVICETPVHVFWMEHPSRPQPFLGLRPELKTSEELRTELKDYEGTTVALRLVPMFDEAGVSKN